LALVVLVSQVLEQMVQTACFHLSLLQAVVMVVDTAQADHLPRRKAIQVVQVAAVHITLLVALAQMVKEMQVALIRLLPLLVVVVVAQALWEQSL
jgi:hypothetical protein